MNTAIALIFLACAVLLAGCGEPAIKPVTANSVIVAFGDSLTTGDNANPDESYPAVLAGILKCKIINAGVSGEVSAEGAARLPAVLKEHKPNLLILCHGGNDMLNNFNSKQTKQNLLTMIKQAKEQKVEVLLIGVPQPGMVLSTADFYKSAAKEADVPLETEAISEILSTPSLKSDQIHPNAAGYRKLAEAIASFIAARRK